jgi:uncharacterized protein (DUF608 family)
MNCPAKGFIPPGAGGIGPFFALYVKPHRGAAVTRVLEGVIPEEQYEGGSGAVAVNAGLPRFRQAEFHAAYPLSQVVLADQDVPVRVRLEAFNPFVPGDADTSGLPVAVLRYVLINPSNRAVEAAVCGMIPNFIGADGSTPSGFAWDGTPQFTGHMRGNHNEFRQGPGLQGVYMSSRELDPASEQWGSLALSVCTGRGVQVTHRTAWAERGWGESLKDFWEDFAADGRLEDRLPGKVPDPKATLAAKVRIPARSERAITFLITWHFPNRQKWFPAPAGAVGARSGGVGNYYTGAHENAWKAALSIASALPGLEERTVRFVRSFCECDLPAVVKEAALDNLSTLRTQTTFRTADGFLFGWEGCHDHKGSCHGSCTHVWNYENALGFLFGSLSRGMRRVEFEHATLDNGLMCFRVGLPLSSARETPKAAADGQMGAIMRLYRDWTLSGDDAFLKSLWPQVRRALEFCWVPGGWDADQDGVMEGCQHNTMDVEYYGPNPQMGLWYLGALRATEEMARHLGEPEFASTCRGLYERGRNWIEQNLFNGEYYEHQIQPPHAPVAEGLRVGMGGSAMEPEFQLGAGCLVDQLVGQYMAHAAGLGYLINPKQARTTLRSIMKYNFKKDFSGHFNHYRSFALNDESALVMASYPHGKRPSVAFPYETEVMTGFEYTAAAGMLYEGLRAEGLTCIQAIRDRYDGHKRNPFDEAECGHHYARAMASWTPVLALTGFHYSAVTGTLAFAASKRPVNWFWSTGEAWGRCRQQPHRGAMRVTLSVEHGAVRFHQLRLIGFGEAGFKAAVLRAGQTRCFLVQPSKQKV